MTREDDGPITAVEMLKREWQREENESVTNVVRRNSDL